MRWKILTVIAVVALAATSCGDDETDNFVEAFAEALSAPENARCTFEFHLISVAFTGTQGDGDIEAEITIEADPTTDPGKIERHKLGKGININVDPELLVAEYWAKGTTGAADISFEGWLFDDDHPIWGLGDDKWHFDIPTQLDCAAVHEANSDVETQQEWEQQLPLFSGGVPVCGGCALPVEPGSISGAPGTGGGGAGIVFADGGPHIAWLHFRVVTQLHIAEGFEPGNKTELT